MHLVILFNTFEHRVRKRRLNNSRRRLWIVGELPHTQIDHATHEPKLNLEGSGGSGGGRRTFLYFGQRHGYRLDHSSSQGFAVICRAHCPLVKGKLPKPDFQGRAGVTLALSNERQFLARGVAAPASFAPASCHSNFMATRTRSKPCFVQMPSGPVSCRSPSEPSQFAPDCELLD
jgi:hypothetical protein